MLIVSNAFATIYSIISTFTLVQWQQTIIYLNSLSIIMLIPELEAGNTSAQNITEFSTVGSCKAESNPFTFVLGYIY